MAAIIIDGVRREVAVARSQDGFVVTVGARRYDVRDVVRMDDGLAFLLDHESHVARVAPGRGGVEISLGGRTYLHTRETVDTDRPASGHGRGGDGRMEAPMPGTIIAVNVKQGDRVRSGQPLIVLESMKMHNEIASPLDGVVRTLNCKVGDQVSFGHVLVEIGAEAS